MAAAKKAILISHYNLQEIVKSLEQEQVLGKSFDLINSALRKSKYWTDITNPKNNKILPNAYFSWNGDPSYILAVPPNFSRPAHIEVRTEFSYCVDKNSSGLPDIQIMSSPLVMERTFTPRGPVNNQVNNLKRCIFDPLINLDALFNIVKDCKPSLDQIVERFCDKKIGFSSSIASLDFAELESPVYFNPKSRADYLIVSFKQGREMKVNVIYRPQV